MFRYNTRPDTVKILRDFLAGQRQGELEWYDRAIELHKSNEEFEAQREAQRQAEQEAANAPRNPVDALRAALSGAGSLKGSDSAEPAALAGSASQSKIGDAQAQTPSVSSAASTTTALNSAELLRAALGGSAGTVNGEAFQGSNE
jgi:hypothetical protein